MSCETCQKMFPIASSLTTLKIGTVTNLNTAYYVYIEDVTTDQIFQYSVTSDAVTGQLDVDPSHEWMESSSYKLWAVQQSADKLHDGDEITVDGSPYKCLEFDVREVIDYNGVCQSFTAQTLHVCS